MLRKSPDIKPRECAICGVTYKPTGSKQLHCEKCRKDAAVKRKRDWYIRNYPDAYKPVEKHHCIVCGEKASCRYKGDGEWYCNKHYLRLYNNGTIEPKQREITNRTVFLSDTVEIYTAKGEKIVVDLADYEKVKQSSWCIDTRGYAVANIKGRVIPIHRVILGNPRCSDHINGDKLNNKRVNLRPCTPQENCRNTQLAKNNKSGFTGVRITPNQRYEARIMLERRSISLGVYDTMPDAIKARIQGELKYFGEFSRNGRRETLYKSYDSEVRDESTKASI